jgi:hypothetical protein
MSNNKDMCELDDEYKFVDITDVKHMLNYLKNSFACEQDKFVPMMRDADCFYYLDSHQANTNVAFTHLLINSTVYPSNSTIKIKLGSYCIFNIGLLLLKEMDLVQKTPNGFIVRLPTDHMLGHIPTLSFVKLRFVVDNVYDYEIQGMSIKTDSYFLPSTKTLIPFLTTDKIVKNTDDISLSKNNQANCVYSFNCYTYIQNANIIGFLVTCNVQDLFSVEILEDNVLYTCSKNILEKCIINERLLWIPMCDSEKKLSHTTNILHVNKIPKLVVNLSFEKMQHDTISVNPYSLNLMNVAFGLNANCSYDHFVHDFGFERFDKLRKIEDEYVIKKNKYSYLIHRKNKKLGVIGTFNDSIVNYIKEHAISKIILLDVDKFEEHLLDMHITQMTILINGDKSNSHTLNNLPIDLENLCIKKSWITTEDKNTIALENIPCTLHKIKLQNVKIDQHSKIPFGTELLA